jgi:pyruvate/2-oxoglutarate dehydrogenase complex dihydrolipoamide dehydrogenase (E3) component
MCGRLLIRRWVPLRIYCSKASLIELSFDRGHGHTSIDDRLVPYVVYTDPQLGHIGLHERRTRVTYPHKKIKTAKMPMSYVARALETDESRGMMKAVIDDENGQILGFTCLGIEGGEVMSLVQMAIIGGVSYEKLRDAIWSHPSLAESLNNILGFLE